MADIETPERRPGRLRKIDLDARIRKSEKSFAAYRRRREIIAIGKEIRRMRQSAGLSQTGLADALGTTQSHVSDLERGVGRDGPSLTLYFRIMRACGHECLSVVLTEESASFAEASEVSTRDARAPAKPASPAVRRSPEAVAEQMLRLLTEKSGSLTGLAHFALLIGAPHLPWSSLPPLTLETAFRRYSGLSRPLPHAHDGSLHESLTRLTLREAVQLRSVMGPDEAFRANWARNTKIVTALGLGGSWNDVLARMEQRERERVSIALEMTSLATRTQLTIAHSGEEAAAQFKKAGRRQVFQFAA
ncbi:MAG: helix-turn-helix domain-containing protein [Azospirillaceae bacterium]